MRTNPKGGVLMSDETTLMPCPFCGAKAEIFCDRVMTWGLVEHREGCLFPTFPNHHIAESDFEAWNHRAVVVDVERFCEVSGL